ncbi:MAG: hypothetical protein J5709_00600 [Bacteroidales bacterium]|nr:hypothetical protein [Bacteroidales bacterium]
MKIGFIIPTYPDEKRVALLPEDIDGFENEIVIEQGFGKNMGIAESEYITKGCRIMSRKEIFSSCDNIFCLKLIQKEDYDLLRDGQTIIGWTHPTGSGKEFYDNVAVRKNLVIVDLDNIYPTIRQGDKVVKIPFLKPNFIWRNSFYAGIASVQHALLNYGMYPDSSTKVAVLSSGNVAQGTFAEISNYNPDLRMFYRKTMHEFYDTIGEYDLIINGIEVDSSTEHIISKSQLAKVKKGCLLIDAAADAGNAIEGTHYTTISNPIYEEDGLYFYEVNNAPSLLYRKTSKEISRSFSENVYKKDISRFLNLL